MDRLEIIQILMKERKLNNYLEIGVFNGHIFFRIKSNFKVAVDPEFRFDSARRIGKTLLNPYNMYNKYYVKTSDSFFDEDAAELFKERQVELALIDGMHEFDYVQRDVENTLQYLAKDGVIILHDCNPLTKEAACSFQEWKERDFAGVWNGDVWKVLVYLQSQRSDVNAFTLDCDHGLGIITWGRPENALEYSKEKVQSLTYEEFNVNRERWLNLKHPSYFYEYFGIKKR